MFCTTMSECCAWKSLIICLIAVMPVLFVSASPKLLQNSIRVCPALTGMAVGTGVADADEDVAAAAEVVAAFVPALVAAEDADPVAATVPPPPQALSTTLPPIPTLPSATKRRNERREGLPGVAIAIPFTRHWFLRRGAASPPA